jgi:hypothetical protein
MIEGGLFIDFFSGFGRFFCFLGKTVPCPRVLSIPDYNFCLYSLTAR